MKIPDDPAVSEAVRTMVVIARLAGHKGPFIQDLVEVNSRQHAILKCACHYGRCLDEECLRDHATELEHWQSMTCK